MLQEVYLLYDEDQRRRIVTAIQINPNGLTYRLSKGIEESWHYAEEIYHRAFSEAGYAVRKVELPISSNGKERVEIDAFCVSDNLKLGVQIKNVVSDEFTDPKSIRNPSKVYNQLTKQFNCCYKRGIIPVLVAPFVNKRFYNFSKRYKGLHCRTNLQFLSPKYAELCSDVKNVLGFGKY